MIQRTLFDNPEAVTRVVTVARAQLQAHVAAGRTIQFLVEAKRDAFPRDVRESVWQLRNDAAHLAFALAGISSTRDINSKTWTGDLLRDSRKRCDSTSKCNAPFSRDKSDVAWRGKG
ncbi:hypothetical protein G4G27_16920 [Sphingomonas sp. So64.6b]|uniref:hypothetical protein n=1 Tax=Sphingomonas sp. So64.6b TaxID=2997354 RepID=UPI0015FF658E|nr:hypothetical protein [Sphingomonas sp. So64.6b]QNA82566.1 hypothetical protein G4G27_16920 [Sphingomonas sp. So64.6b]